MTVQTKIEPIGTSIALLVNSSLSASSQSTALAEFARNEILKVDAVHLLVFGRNLAKAVFVDGRRDMALTSVKPESEISVEWDLTADVLRWVLETLDERSPVVSGAYRDGHTAFADGVELKRGEPIPPGTQVVTVINLVPYSRRLEIGKTRSGRDFIVQVPNRIYERTAKDAKARFGNIAKIEFGYEAAVGAYRLKQDQAHRSWSSKGWRVRARQSRDRVAGSVVSAPAIRIILKD